MLCMAVFQLQKKHTHKKKHASMYYYLYMYIFRCNFIIKDKQNNTLSNIKLPTDDTNEQR